MPGFVIHMAAAKEALRLRGIEDTNYINDYMIGSVAPDLAEGEAKKQTHFWDEYGFSQFVRKPNLDAFTKRYGSLLDEPYAAGFYHHLLLDVMFLELYWRKHFRFLNDRLDEALFYEEVSNVRLLDDGKVYPKELFFSDDMYYGDYTRMNPYFIRKYKLEEFSPQNCIAVIEERNYDFPKVRKKIIDVLGRSAAYENPKVFVISEMDRLVHDSAVEITKRLNAIKE